MVRMRQYTICLGNVLSRCHAISVLIGWAELDSGKHLNSSKHIKMQAWVMADMIIVIESYIWTDKIA